MSCGWYFSCYFCQQQVWMPTSNGSIVLILQSSGTYSVSSVLSDSFLSLYVTVCSRVLIVLGDLEDFLVGMDVKSPQAYEMITAKRPRVQTSELHSYLWWYTANLCWDFDVILLSKEVCQRLCGFADPYSRIALDRELQICWGSKLHGNFEMTVISIQMARVGETGTVAGGSGSLLLHPSKTTLNPKVHCQCPRRYPMKSLHLQLAWYRVVGT